MEWQQILLIVGSNLAMLLGLLVTTIALHIHGSSQSNIQIAAIREEMSAIREEMKDFHGRLCAIEERRLKEKNK